MSFTVVAAHCAHKNVLVRGNDSYRNVIYISKMVLNLGGNENCVREQVR